MTRLPSAALLSGALLSLASPSAAAAGVIGADASACAAGGGPAIRADIVGLKDRVGDVKLELYPATDGDFLKDDNILLAEGKTFRRVMAATPASGAVSLCIRAPRPGRYGLLFTHNRDGRSKFSIWADGAGIVTNAKLGRGKPTVAQSTVEVGATLTTVTIRAQYMRGLAGFGPIG